jgi:phosphoribosylformylglycinamidine (FGAM) synthase PurS component
MDLEKEMNELLKKHLPEHVGVELRKVLKQAEDDKEALSSATEANKRSVSKVRELEDALILTNKQLSEHASLDERTSKVIELERNQKVFELQIKLSESEKRADMVQGFTNNLVRNTVVRESILDSESINHDGYYDKDNNWVVPYTKNVTKNYDKTTSKE